MASERAEQPRAAFVCRLAAQPAVTLIRCARAQVGRERTDLGGEDQDGTSGDSPRARADELGMETVGLTPGRHVEVDEHLRVPGPDWPYALGDLNGRALPTHMGKCQARIAAETILGENARLVSDGAASPRVVITDREVLVGATFASWPQAHKRAGQAGR